MGSEALPSGSSTRRRRHEGKRAQKFVCQGLRPVSAANQGAPWLAGER